MLGRANAGREWLCGGIRRTHLELALAMKIRSYLVGINPLGRSHSRCVGAQVSGDAVASGSAGHCNHVIARRTW